MESPLWRSHQQPVTAKSWRRWLRHLAVVFFSVVTAAGGAVAVLLLTLRSSQTQIQLDIIKTGLAVGAGAGALVTLMYGARRQLLAEETAQDAKVDATEKRVIGLYTTSIEQFGSDQLPVRLGGLYALERLAENTPDIRDRVVDVICAYLRAQVKSGDAGDSRSAAQDVLIDHLAYQSPFNYHLNYWPIKGLNLSGADLVGFMFGAAKVDTVHFHQTIFRGKAFFAQAMFRGADFGSATFDGPATFDGARFGKAIFSSAKFRSEANFKDVRFYIDADFTAAEFASPPSFEGARALMHEEANYVLPPMWEIRMPSSQHERTIAGEIGSWAYIVKADIENQSNPSADQASPRAIDSQAEQANGDDEDGSSGALAPVG